MGVHKVSGLSYTMSWELYRALKGEGYSYSDKLLDEAWVGTQKRQVLWWDKQGFGHIVFMEQKAADAFEANRKEQRKKRFKEQCWSDYHWIQEGTSFELGIQDTLYELRKTLEDLE